MYLVVSIASLATLRSVEIIHFGNFWSALFLIGMQNIAGKGKTVTQVLSIDPFYYWQECTVIYCQLL